MTTLLAVCTEIPTRPQIERFLPSGFVFSMFAHKPNRKAVMIVFYLFIFCYLIGLNFKLGWAME